MPFGQPEFLLKRFPVFRTEDPDLFRHSLLTSYGAARVDIHKPIEFRAWANYIQLGDTALGFAGCNTAIALHFPEMEFVRQQFAVSGRAATTTAGVMTDVNASHACTTSLGRPMRVDCEPWHERLTLRIKTSAIESKLAMLLGVRPKALLEFQPTVDLENPAAQGLFQFVMFLAQQLNEETDRLPPLVLQELEQSIIISFLCSNEHVYSDKLRDRVKSTAPRYVVVAEEYIAEHWKEALTIDRLVEVTGISARALFRSFRQYRGYAPMEFLKKIRLERARAALTSGIPDISVKSTAFDCGFASIGHFARDYSNAFGELPSQTLRRMR
jgi:AraC-like DNA-binding protein